MYFSKVTEKLMFFFIYAYVILYAVLPSKFNLLGIHFSGDYILAVIILLYILNLVVSSEARKMLISGIKDFFKDYLSLSIFLVTALMFISISYALSKGTAINESIRFSTYIVLYFIIKYHSSNKVIVDNILKSYLFVVTLVSALGIFEYISGKTSWVRISKLGVEKRIVSTLENPNNLGVFLILAVFPLLVLLIHERNKMKKAMYFIVLSLVTINLVLTGSRNAWLALLGGIVIFLFMYNKKLTIGIIIFGSFTLFLPPVMKIVKAFSDVTFNINRIKTWKLALLIFKDHPLKGIGIGNYKFAYNIYITKYPNLALTDEVLMHPHNAFLKIITEVGIIAGVLFTVFLILLLIRTLNFIKSCKVDFYNNFYKGFLISLILFILMNTVDSFLSAPKVMTYFWILVGAQQALNYSYKIAKKV